MKQAIVISVAILFAAQMVSKSIKSLQQTIAFQSGKVSNAPGFPSQITVVPPNGGFRISGDFQRTPEQRSNGQMETQDSFANVTNVRLVESRVTPDQLAAAPRTLMGRWRDENSYAEFRPDHTCNWTGDNGNSNNYQWRLEGDTIFETRSDGHKYQLRILELDDRHFVYQEFPTGSIWRAYRVEGSPQAEKAPQ